MAILIKGMEMPKKCSKCEFWTITPCTATFQGEKSCQLIEVPEPHGRLIDADTMIASVKRQAGFLKIMGGDLTTVAEILEKGILQEIENAPTVIPAEEGE